MRFRTVSLAFLLSTVSLGAAWLALHPTFVSMIEVSRVTSHPEAVQLLARATRALPLYLALAFFLLTLVTGSILYFSVERPLRRAEATIDHIARMEWEFPLPTGNRTLTSRLQWALNRLSAALRDEQTLTQKQLASLREANERMSLMQTELWASERLASMGRLAAGVAHEVGNPLAGILGYLSLLKSRSPSGPELADWVQRIEVEVLRIDQIVKGLLLLGRPAKGKSEPVDILETIESSLRLLTAGPDFAQVEVALEVPRGTLAWAEAGPLTQVMLNLSLNAAQAMASRGRLCIRAVEQEDRVLISVSDTGPGIAPEAMAHLFEPFFTTKPVGRGSGLGLAVSRHLVGAMGGTLHAGHAEGGGACFTVMLPSVKVAAA